MKKNPNRNTATRTTEVVACTSLREGVTTLRVSARTSVRKLVNFRQKPTTFPERLETALGSCRLIGAGRSSPFTVAVFEAILPILLAPGVRPGAVIPVQSIFAATARSTKSHTGGVAVGC